MALYLEAIYSIWLREFKVYTREKERAISSIVTPLMWLFAFGAGLGSSVSVSGMNYQEFIFPGILAMNVLFTSMFYGMYIVWDKKLDLMKEMLVAPVPRWAVFIGKCLGGLTNSLFQVFVLLLVGIMFGWVRPDPFEFAFAMLAAALFGFFCVSVGLFIGSKLSSPDSFSLVMSFVMWPMFLTSGGLYPASNLPPYLHAIISVNPMAYGVDLLRGLIIENWSLGWGTDVAVLAVVGLLSFYFGSKSFEKMSLG